MLVRTPLVDDSTLENRENFTLTVNVTSNPALVANTEAAATAYIIDDEGEPTITVNDVTYNEAAGTATFTITLSVPVAGAVSVDWATSNGTAIAGSDYTAASGTLTFAAGETTKTVTVAITNDSIYEISENFFITLSNVASGPYSTTVSVADERGGPLTSGNSQTVDLVASGGLVSGILSGGGTITLATDFQQTPFPKTGLEIVSGESATALTAAEAEVTATLWIDGRIFVLVDARDAGTAWTYNAASGQLESEVSFDDARELVLAGGMTFRDYVNGVAGAGTLGGTLTAYLAANATEAGDTWTFAYDDNNGGNQQARKVDFTLSFDGGSSVSLGAPGTGTIKDDGTGTGGTNNDRPTLSVNDVVYNEAAGTVTFTVTMSNASAVATTVDYATANRSPVSALAGADYTAASGTLTIAAGSLSGTVSVAIANDTLYEISEDFLLDLSNPSNATVLDGQGVATIKDDGTGTGGSNNDRPQIVVNDVDYNEAAGFVVFTVSLSNPSAIGAVGFDLSMLDGSATGAGTDFGAAGSENLQISLDNGVTWTDATAAEIPALATSVLVRTPLLNDTPFEIAETFSLRLANLQGDALFSKAIGIATIRDDGTGLGGTDNDAPVIVPVAADPPQLQALVPDPIKPVNEPKPVSDGLKGEVESVDLIILPSIANQGSGSPATYLSENSLQVRSGLGVATSGTGSAAPGAGDLLLMSASNSDAGHGWFTDPGEGSALVPANPGNAPEEERVPQAAVAGGELAANTSANEIFDLWAEAGLLGPGNPVTGFTAGGSGFSAALAFERARFDREAAAMLAIVNTIESARLADMAG